MSIVDKINEKTGKFANNIAEAVADLLGHDLKATTIVENIGEGNNITEAIDKLSGKQSANIAEAIDNYCGVEHTTTTIEEALENIGEGPEPTPTEKLLFEGGAVDISALEGSTPITPNPFTPVFTESYTGNARVIFRNYQEKIGEDGEWVVYPTYESIISTQCVSSEDYDFGEIHFTNGAYITKSSSTISYVYENGDATRYSKWDSVEITETDEELILNVGSLNLKDYETEHGTLDWDYQDVNEGDTLRARLIGIVGHVGSETESINSIDTTGTVEFGVGVIDNYTFYASIPDYGAFHAEVDSEAISRYNGDIDISQIIVTRIPNTTATISTTPNFNTMTKAEIQAWADENNISGVDQNSQTKDQMIETIEAALNA